MRADRLVAARKRVGWTQADLAAAIGKHRTVVAHAEADRGGVSLDSWQKIATALDVSLDYLAGRTDDPTPWDAIAADWRLFRLHLAELAVLVEKLRHLKNPSPETVRLGVAGAAGALAVLHSILRRDSQPAAPRGAPQADQASPEQRPVPPIDP